MQTTINRNLLSYAVGHVMTCRFCSTPMDVTRAVHVTLEGLGQTWTRTLCASCFDRNRADIEAAAAGTVVLTVLDGRELFGQPAEAPAPARKRPATPARKRTDPYTGPFPRKRHSHHCKGCEARGQINAVACYKQGCARPQTTEKCSWCNPSPLFR